MNKRKDVDQCLRNYIDQVVERKIVLCFATASKDYSVYKALVAKYGSLKVARKKLELPSLNYAPNKKEDRNNRIRELVSRGISQSDVARKYNLSRQRIERIVNNNPDRH